MQQHYSISFYEKKIFYSSFLWLTRPFECQILTILALTKCLQILLKDSTLSIISITKKISSLGCIDTAENGKRHFFWTPDI